MQIIQMVKGKKYQWCVIHWVSTNSWFCYAFSLIPVERYVMLYYHVLAKVGPKLVERLRPYPKFSLSILLFMK